MEEFSQVEKDLIKEFKENVAGCNEELAKKLAKAAVAEAKKHNGKANQKK